MNNSEGTVWMMEDSQTSGRNDPLRQDNEKNDQLSVLIFGAMCPGAVCPEAMKYVDILIVA